MNRGCLLLENIHPQAQSAIESAGFDVTRYKQSLSGKELELAVKGKLLLGIRSKTHLPRPFFESSNELAAVGAFCIGTNQIEVEAATQAGVAVFNAPYANTRSVAELVICEIIALSRMLSDRSKEVHGGVWKKSADGCKEVRGKSIGIVGYGHIGSQLSILAEGLGMQVFYYDIIKKLPLGNATSLMNLDDLLARVDFVTLHVPETPQTKNMIRAPQLDRMKKGACLINASRGTVVDISALSQALKSGHLSGAAVDVFPTEPASNSEVFKSELQGIPNVILTPHVAGSTEEAQEAIGIEVSESLLKYWTSGTSYGSVNFPWIQVDPPRDFDRIANVHKNVPGVLSQINKVISQSGGNIRLQNLATNSEIGYLILDVEDANVEKMADEIAKIDTSLRTRVIRKV